MFSRSSPALKNYINLMKPSPAIFVSILPSFDLYRYTCDKHTIKAE